MRQDHECAPLLVAMPRGSCCAAPQELDLFYGRLADMSIKQQKESMPDQCIFDAEHTLHVIDKMQQVISVGFRAA